MKSLIFLFLLQAQAAPTPASSPFFNDLENFKGQSLTLQTEKQTLEATSDTLLSRRLFWTPNLSVSANSQKNEFNDVVTSDSNYLRAEASLNLFRAGADWNSLQSAKAQHKAQELAVLNESLNVEIKASDLIFKSIYLFEIKRIQEEFLKLKEESRKIVSDRYAQGRTPLQEVTKSEVDLVQQKNKVRLANLDLIENKTEIATLFVTELQTKAWPFNETVTTLIEASQKLPLAEQKYWESQSAEQSWRSQKSGHWPSIDLVFRVQDSPIKERTDRETVGMVSLTLPLWSQYETAAQISTAYARYIGTRNDFLQTDQELKLRNSFLKEKIEIARVNLTEAKKNLEKSKSLYQDILRSFRLGRLSTNDLFLEQNRLLESQTSLAVSQLSFHQTLIEMCALAGTKSSDCLKSN